MRERVACHELPLLPRDALKMCQVLKNTCLAYPVLGVQVGTAAGAVQIVLLDLCVAVLAELHVLSFLPE